ncbi:GTP-binding protein EsdC [Aspergillus fijiensis CBS 313.89]|uniref:GTP-binding protein EsdC n=4 Tax=Aspergillus TaxID=5052 RepID=A0A2V5GYX9_ASPV1|nr:GTP-binding protein EsdC [Aspergillus japonicus CBS 114.51]XP_040801119.1 GTP-binding protein EsdC [Aspergillus fijiensis CBS 313.89]PYI16708.1 GTP-binding protein EsdC [Aspergillus violaceofuscus CBS 115571]PYI32834.1 GTP-binding protein EsdC [Aspergillus indologenus CBS 114.80]RAH84032.1 GTP-binding protein EsdC [Aspergillus japonicus CBS 114.51]RAK77109.1 GTP-binding protein EsdC [Aspergillus fijiensis CBS 313.89]
MSSVQLKFSLRTSSNVKTVHLVGSWDNYSRQIPLSRDENKSGSWVGKFRFQTSMLKLGGRYWYYYIMDGYHVSHDPAVEYTVEPTTGRKLNILDVPGGKSSSSSSAPSKSHRRTSAASEVVKGRALSPSKIQHPKPSKPYASRQIRETDFVGGPPTMDDLTRRFAGSRLSDEYSLSNSPPSSAGSSLSSRSSGSTSPSSLSSMSDPPTPICRCERYGITRKGDRVKLDCGGSRCGYVTESSEASCSESEDSDEEYRRARSAVRRQGIVVRR